MTKRRHSESENAADQEREEKITYTAAKKDYTVEENDTVYRAVEVVLLNKEKRELEKHLVYVDDAIDDEKKYGISKYCVRFGYDGYDDKEGGLFRKNKERKKYFGIPTSNEYGEFADGEKSPFATEEQLQAREKKNAKLSSGSESSSLEESNAAISPQV